ncbi:MAG: hypothetical protein DRQ55_13175 [Planctomycetota bacterium]|nr:MAG: hypothetical protein DRQ55_13175 [Planctomycetota bacterium]
MPAPDHDLKRREFLKATAAATVAASLPACDQGARVPAPSRRPNVLFVFSDSHRAASTGCYGNGIVRTPHIDAFAQQGVRLTTAVSSLPECRPFRGSLMTGAYAHQHGILANKSERNVVGADGRWRPRALPTLGSSFAAAGYRCGYVGKWHLGSARLDPGELRFGFNDYWAAAISPVHDYLNWSYCTGADDVVHVRDRFRPAGEVDLARDFISSADERPWLLCLSWGPPHKPHQPPADFDRYRDIARPADIPTNYSLKPLAGYYGLVEAIDHEFGRLLATIDELGQAQDTLVVYTSDHGAMVGSHGLSGKEVPYSHATCVPFIVRLPGRLAAGTTMSQPFGSPDIFPTLAGLAGVPVPAGVQGLDFSATLAGEATATLRDAAFMAAYEPPPLPWPGWRGVMTETHMYARTVSGPTMLYDRRADPLEQENLIGRQPALRDELDARTVEAMRDLEDEWGAA